MLTTRDSSAEVEYLRDAITYAPRLARSAPGLRGHWTPNGNYVCAECAGRIVARGCGLPRDSAAVWMDSPEPYGVCVCCGR